MDYKDFKENTLYPALYECIDRVFPEMCFKRTRNGWESAYHLPSMGGCKSGDKDQSYVSKKYAGGTRVYDNGARGNGVNLIDLYMEFHNVDFATALKDLADICGLILPESGGDWRQDKREQDEREKICNALKARLWAENPSPQAKAVLSYLREQRGWTDEEIKAAEIGCVTPIDVKDFPSLLQKLPMRGDKTRAPEVGVTHTMVIPYRNGSRLFGFKYREVGADTGLKYINSKGTTKGAGLFGIVPGVKDLVIVEGELDALRAKANGAVNVAATTGNAASGTQIAEARRRGVETFTLLFDNDSKGKSFIIPTIEEIHQQGGKIYVAELPSDCKDSDEFITAHGIGAWKEAVKKALSYSVYILNTILAKYSDTEKYPDGLSAKDRDALFGEVERLYNSPYTEPTDRDLLNKMFNECADTLMFSPADFQEYLNKAKERQEEARRKEALCATLESATSLAKQGRIDEAQAFMESKTRELHRQDAEGKFSRLLALPNEKDIRAGFKQTKEGVPTYYYFGEGQEQEQLILPRGALTYICAPTSHGKSRMLENLALQVTTNGQPGDVLYFSFEEDASAVQKQCLNIFASIDLAQNNRRSIDTYFRTGEEFFKQGKAEEFHKREADFFRLIDDSTPADSKLRVYYEDYYCGDLVEAIRYLHEKKRVKAVFIDYVQLLYIRDTRLQRKDELTEICKAFMKLAIETQLPIVMAAQLNREALSPIEMTVQNICDASNIEHSANIVMLLWNSAVNPLAKSAYFVKKKGGKDKDLCDDANKIAQRGFCIGKPGTMYAILAKNRAGARNIDSVLGFNGNTGKISQIESITASGTQSLGAVAEQIGDADTSGAGFDDDDI